MYVWTKSLIQMRDVGWYPGMGVNSERYGERISQIYYLGVHPWGNPPIFNRAQFASSVLKIIILALYTTPALFTFLGHDEKELRFYAQ